MKQNKLQWVQNPSQTNGDNLNNVRRETSEIFKEKREYLREKKLMSLKENSENKNIRGKNIEA
jgi:hypothetical protein